MTLVYIMTALFAVWAFYRVKGVEGTYSEIKRRLRPGLVVFILITVALIFIFK